MQSDHGCLRLVLLVATLFAAQTPVARAGDTGQIGINVLLNAPVTSDSLTMLAAHGIVLDVIPELNAVTMRAHASQLPTIQTLACVAAAGRDARRSGSAATMCAAVPDLANGSNQWSLDAINVTDFNGGRTVAYDGEGVYVAVIDDGLKYSWRSYLPEDRVDTVHARSFSGGGGDHGTVSSQPNVWEHSSRGAHGTAMTSVLLGFHYSGPEQLPAAFNGVAPKVSVIPINVYHNANFAWSSVIARAITYVVGLKTSGELGDAPLVISMSGGGFAPEPLERAAIDYAIANGAVFVAAAGNEADFGMRWPGAYPEVISAAAVGWVEATPPDDPINWILHDVPEGDVSEFFVAPFSAWELPGQDLDIAAPGWAVPAPWAEQNGQLDWSFNFGTSPATPHISGVVALMLQKNPNLTAAEVETILESTTAPLTAGCADFVNGIIGPGNPFTWSDYGNVQLVDATTCWGANTTGHGLLQADAALLATPMP